MQPACQRLHGTCSQHSVVPASQHQLCTWVAAVPAGAAMLTHLPIRTWLCCRKRPDSASAGVGAQGVTVHGRVDVLRVLLAARQAGTTNTAAGTQVWASHAARLRCLMAFHGARLVSMHVICLWKRSCQTAPPAWHRPTNATDPETLSHGWHASCVGSATHVSIDLPTFTQGPGC